MSTEQVRWQRAADATVVSTFEALRIAFQQNADDLAPPIGNVTMRPYVDTAALDVPWPMHSHFKQPWRGWSETVPATRLRDGVGINYQWHVERDHDADMARYAAAGIRRTRTEVSWALASYSTGALTAATATKLTEIVQAAQAHGIRPLLLVNGNHVNPCPWLTVNTTTLVATAAGSRTMRVGSVTGMVPHYTGLSSPGFTKMAGALVITVVGGASRTLTFSKPLPQAYPVGTPLTFHTLKARPLRDPGTAEYEETVTRWLTYVRSLCQTVLAAGVPSFDLEVWNELTFGSDFLDASNYYDPPVTDPTVHPLSPGGRLWSFGERTVAMLAAEFPTVNAVWGFSNTTFFSGSQDPDTGDLQDLPPNVTGQSAHPYFFWPYNGPEDEQYGAIQNFEGIVPPAPYRVAMPEKALTFINTESLSRLLNPSARAIQPAWFQHSMTEHGPDVNVDSDLVDDENKQRMALRSVVAFLHAGITGLYLFADRESELALDPVVLPVLTRLHGLVSGAEDVPTVPLTIEVGMPDPGEVFPGLTHLDTLAVFPFQVAAEVLGLAVYVMTRDMTDRAPERVARIRLDVTGSVERATDLLTGADVPVTILETAPLTFELAVADCPRWVEVRL